MRATKRLPSAANVSQAFPNDKKKGSKKKEPPKLEGDHASAALHLAAKKGHTKAVREILDAGVDPNAVWKGTTAMALAAAYRT